LAERLADAEVRTFDMKKGMDLDKVLSGLTKKDRSAAMMELSRHLREHVPWFNHVSEEFVNALVLRMKCILRLDGEWVIRKGEQSTHIFFLQHGEMELVERVVDSNPAQIKQVRRTFKVGPITIAEFNHLLAFATKHSLL
jgi:hypothetical protein